MDKPIMLLLKFRRDTIVFKVFDNFGFDDLVQVVTAKYSNLESGNLSFKYSVGSHVNCCLSNDEDCENMILLAGLLSVRVITIDVVEIFNVISFGMNKGVFLVDDHRKKDAQTLHRDSVQNSYDGSFSNQDSVHSNRDGSFSSFNASSSHQSKFVDSASIESEDDSVPCYDICPTQPRNDLLSAGWGSIITGTGQIFKGGMDEFRTELIKYSFKIGFDYTFVKNTNKRIVVECTRKFSDQCNWFVKARISVVDNSVCIYKSDLVHNCHVSAIDLAAKSRRIGCGVIADLIIENVRNRPTFSSVDVIDYMMTHYGITISYSKAWRSVDNARKKIFGGYEESFQQLQWYVKALRSSNPGSFAVVESDDVSKRFNRLFFSFRACIDGFKYCRPILFIDGTFMKSRFKGTLLSATAKDGNQGLFPLAFAVVSAENRDNWFWFLSKIKEVIVDRDVLFVSDRNIGLIEAMSDVFGSSAKHFYCLVHLYRNLRDMYKGKSYSGSFRSSMCTRLKDCAYAPNVRLFNEKLAIFKQEGGQIACDFLVNLPFERWAIAHSHEKRYAELTSNAAESFNNWILDARALPITHMMDCIRSKIMNWFVERLTIGRKWSKILCPKMDKKWMEYSNVGMTWKVRVGCNSIFEVLSNPTVVVDLLERTCSCYQWQIMGFPCTHAAIAIMRSGKKIEEMVEDYFFTTNYIKCYEGNLMPIPTTERYDVVESFVADKILPPVTKKLAGRPKKNRIASKGESTSKKKRFCSRCHKLCNHNSRTCRDAIQM